MGNKANNRTAEEQAILDYRMGLEDGGRGDEYNNPYRGETPNFTNYETGFVEGKGAHLNQEAKNGR